MVLSQVILPPGNTWRCLETFWLSQVNEGATEWMPGVLLHQQCAGQPPRHRTPQYMLMVPRLGTRAFQ